MIRINVEVWMSMLLSWLGMWHFNRWCGAEIWGKVRCGWDRPSCYCGCDDGEGNIFFFFSILFLFYLTTLVAYFFFFSTLFLWQCYHTGIPNPIDCSAFHWRWACGANCRVFKSWPGIYIFFSPSCKWGE